MNKNSLLIKNANIIDGTGNDGFIGNVSIEDGIITDVGNIEGDFETIIDAKGLTLTPGFILILNYVGMAMQRLQLSMV